MKGIYYLGSMYIKKTDVINVTDPCYDDDTWCTAKLDKFKEGWYEAYVYLKQERVMSLRIVHRSFAKQHKNIKPTVVIHDIGVDSGLCGIFIDKPDYKDEQWQEICNILEKLEHPIKVITNKNGPFECTGIVTSSGYGDGIYCTKLDVDAEGLIYFCEIDYGGE